MLPSASFFFSVHTNLWTNVFVLFFSLDSLVKKYIDVLSMLGTAFLNSFLPSPLHSLLSATNSINVYHLDWLLILSHFLIIQVLVWTHDVPKAKGKYKIWLFAYMEVSILSRS